MKKIVLIGKNGQVTRYLQAAFAGSDHEVQVLSREQLDLSDITSIQAVLEASSPSLIINPAAFTAVDLAEEQQESAMALNRDAVAEIASYSARTNTPLIHFSTDYVFAGDATEPYTENDATEPTGVYGQSKLDGEQAILDLDAPAVILRTSWVYSNHGKNFYKTMLSLAATRDQLSVVGDQVGAPTYAGSIAESAKKLAEVILDQGGLNQEQKGIYHFTCQGQTSWADFAKAIFVENEINSVTVNSISTEEYPTPAKRPAYSVLNGDKLSQVFDIALPHWGTALAQCAAEAKNS